MEMNICTIEVMREKRKILHKFKRILIKILIGLKNSEE